MLYFVTGLLTHGVMKLESHQRSALGLINSTRYKPLFRPCFALKI